VERRFDKKYLDIAPFAPEKFYIDTGDQAPKHDWYILSVKGKQEVQADIDFGILLTDPSPGRRK